MTTGARATWEGLLEPACEAVHDVRKIAVLRANALGDFVFTLPALESLRARYPDAEIVLLARAWHAAFLRARPGPVDRVVVVPAFEGVFEPAASQEKRADLEQFLACMRAEQFDLGVQLHGGGRHSNPLMRRLGARLTVGARAPGAAPLDRTIPYVYYQSEVMRFLEIVGLAGARAVTVEPRVPVTVSDLEESRVVAPDEQPLAVLHPGAHDPRRRWPAACFAEVGDALAARGLRVVITGTPHERTLIGGVATRMRAPATRADGRLSTAGLTGLLARSAVVVSNDTGPLHLAQAVGAPTVGIFWCGNLINAGPPTRRRHRPLLSWRLACPECGVDCTADLCPHDRSFVADVPVDAVREAALDLLTAEEGPAARGSGYEQAS